MAETSYTTLLIHAVETLEQDFARYIVEIRLQGETEVIAELTGGAVRQKNLAWLMTPLEWGGAVIGTTYEHRIFVEDTDGNRSPVTDWVSETAGDTTAPTAPATFTLESTIATAKCSFSYTKPTDFDRFEWIVKYDDNSNPVSTDSPNYTTLEPNLIVGAASGQEVSFWVRAIDQSGNINSGGYIDCGDIFSLPPASVQNLIGNSGFELGLTGWESNANLTLGSGANARSGDKYAKFKGNSSVQRVYWLEYFPVLPGEQYNAEVWIREDEGTGETAGIGIAWYSADRQTIQLSDTLAGVSPNNYISVTFTETAPANKYWARFYIIVGSDVTSSITMWFDDIIFRILQVTDSAGDGEFIVAMSGLWLNIGSDGKLYINTSKPATHDATTGTVVGSQS